MHTNMSVPAHNGIRGHGKIKLTLQLCRTVHGCFITEPCTIWYRKDVPIQLKCKAQFFCYFFVIDFNVKICTTRLR